MPRLVASKHCTAGFGACHIRPIRGRHSLLISPPKRQGRQLRRLLLLHTLVQYPLLQLTTATKPPSPQIFCSSVALVVDLRHSTSRSWNALSLQNQHSRFSPLASTRCVVNCQLLSTSRIECDQRNNSTPSSRLIDNTSNLFSEGYLSVRIKERQIGTTWIQRLRHLSGVRITSTSNSTVSVNIPPSCGPQYSRPSSLPYLYFPSSPVHQPSD